MNFKNKITSILLLLLLFFTNSTCYTIYAMNPVSDIIYHGMDVSSYQGNIDFIKVKNQGIQAVYIKAGQGNNITDSYFEKNYINAKNANIKVGFYYYVTAKSVYEAKQQAKRFSDLISEKKYSLRPTMDFEEFGNLSNEEINNIGVAFLEELKDRVNVIPMIYTDDYAAKEIWDYEFSNYPVWIAEYNGASKPGDNPIWDSWTGFQYSNKGKLIGISGDVDLDMFTDKAIISYENEKNTQKDYIIYVVKDGDTLWGIANKYNVSLYEIADFNNIKNINLIYVDQKIIIPKYTNNENFILYKVKPGDTLWGISIKYGASLSSIININHLSNPNLIFPGEIIKIKN